MENHHDKISHPNNLDNNRNVVELPLDPKKLIEEYQKEFTQLLSRIGGIRDTSFSVRNVSEALARIYVETQRAFGEEHSAISDEIRNNKETLKIRLETLWAQESETSKFGSFLERHYSDHLTDVQSTYGKCNVCGLFLFPPEFSQDSERKWLHCSLCGDFDQCRACSEIKKSNGFPLHSHQVEAQEWMWKLFPQDAELKVQGQDNLLCFDGGGIRGYTSILMFEKYCLLLRQFAPYETPPEETLDDFAARLIHTKFDIICGTSIGGIVALMLAMGVRLSKIRAMFEEKASMIFEKQPWYRLGSTAYSDAGLKTLFREVVLDLYNDLRNDPALKSGIRHLITEDKTKDPDPMQLELGDISISCGVTSYDLIMKQAVWMSSVFTPKIKVIDAMLSTSAAPTYFPIHAFTFMDAPIQNLRTGERLEPRPRTVQCVDGGLWGNDPRLFAFFVERIKNFLKRNTIYNIISFGTGTFADKQLNFEKGWQSSLGWIPKYGSFDVVNITFDAGCSMVDEIFKHCWVTGLLKTVKVQYEFPSEVKLDDITLPERHKRGEFFQLDTLPRPKEGTTPSPNATLDKHIRSACNLTMRMGMCKKRSR